MSFGLLFVIVVFLSFVMFDIFFIVFLFFFSTLCFFEFIVFNEEILLALCFFSFIFFCFNTLSDTVFNSFDDRASKFESDLLLSYNSSKQTLTANFQNFFKLRGFNAKFKILLTIILFYFKQFSSYSVFKFNSSIFAFSSSKLSELFLLDQKLISAFQKNCITTLLYPLIFKTTKNHLVSLTASFNFKNISKTTNKNQILKFLSH
jgi:hypothetical protein